MREVTVQITIPRRSPLERLLNLVGMTATRCPYCGGRDLRPATHLEGGRCK